MKLSDFIRLFLLCSLVLSLNARATTVTPPSFSELVTGSDYIVRAKIQSVSSQWQETPTGRKIFSDVELMVEEVVAGTPPMPLILRVLGGKVGKQEMAVVGAPKLTVGEEGFFFITGNGRQIYPLTGLMHGLYPIRRASEDKREFVTRGNGEPLRNVDSVSQPMKSGKALEAIKSAETVEALSPTEFTRGIKAVLSDEKLTEKTSHP